MDHPFFKNIRTTLIYIAIWILISGVHFAVLYAHLGLSFSLCLADSIISNMLLGILCFALWYTVLYYKPTQASFINLLITHVTSATLKLLIFVSASISLLKLFVPENGTGSILLSSSIPWRIIDGLSFYIISILIYYLIIYYRNLQEKLQQEALLLEKIKEAELNVLKSQINPHFLFNSLNSVSSLTMTEPEKAQEMIIKLSDYLRYSISMRDNKFSVLKEEFKNIQRYLEIEKVRFGEKLQYIYDIDENCFSEKIPIMILQPLYENAVKHGVYESTEKIIIKTTGKLSGNFLELSIKNNFEKDFHSSNGAGLGLKNISERLKLIYNMNGLLKTIITETDFEVILHIPIHETVKF